MNWFITIFVTDSEKTNATKLNIEFDLNIKPWLNNLL